MITILDKHDTPKPLFTFLYKPREGRRSKPIADKYRSPKWWDRENMPYAADYITRNKYAEWVWMIDWKLICTLTFPSRVSDDPARQILYEFIDRLERVLHCDVGCVYGEEKRFAGYGKPACGRHFHVLLTSVTVMHPPFIEWLWRSLPVNRSDDASARVEQYYPTQFGVRYVLKSISKPFGDWGFRNLHVFHPEALNFQDLTRRQRRHLRRHKDRLKKFQ